MVKIAEPARDAGLPGSLAQGRWPRCQNRLPGALHLWPLADYDIPAHCVMER